MWRITVRDLQWRRRRFIVAVAATGLVFAITLLLTGVIAGLDQESRRIVASFGADTWLVHDGTPGPFTATVVLPASIAEDVARQDGVDRADPVLLVRATVQSPGGEVEDVNLIGLAPGGLGEPEVDEGRAVEAPGEAVLDAGLGRDVGDSVAVGGRQLEVVGVAGGVSYAFGTRTIYVELADAQAIAFGGEPVVSAIVVQGAPVDPPPGTTAIDDAAARADVDRPLARGVETIDLVRFLLTLTAAGIVGLIVYLSSIERGRDVAVLKATGASGAFVAGGLVLQSIVLTLAAALLACVLAFALAPVFPLALQLEPAAFASLGALAIVVGILASLVGVRRALVIDPAAAFGGPG